MGLGLSLRLALALALVLALTWSQTGLQPIAESSAERKSLCMASCMLQL